MHRAAGPGAEVIGISSGSAARHAAFAGYHKLPFTLLSDESGQVRVSELGQLGERRQDPHPTRTEVHDHCGVTLGQDDPAEAVLVVGHLIANSELLSRWIRGRGIEGTRGQEAPGSGGDRLHYHQYAPLQLQPLIPRRRDALAPCAADGRPPMLSRGRVA
jgi:hypothetical protein